MRCHRWAVKLSGRQVALKEHDERQLYLARQNIRDLRNIYAVLTDIIHKNLAKVRLSGHVYLVVELIYHSASCTERQQQRRLVLISVIFMLYISEMHPLCLRGILYDLQRSTPASQQCSMRY